MLLEGEEEVGGSLKKVEERPRDMQVNRGRCRASGKAWKRRNGNEMDGV